MTDALRILKGDDFMLDGVIKIHHPTLSEISDMGEKEYYGLISSICATPSDYKSVLLDNFNIDYEEVGEFEFFLMMWGGISSSDLNIILPDIDTSSYVICQHKDTNEIGLYSDKDDVFINDKLYNELVEYIRKLHGITKRVDKAGNETTKNYLIKKARRELNNAKNKKYESTLAPLISSMVNSKEFKYNYDNVWDLNIYQFMDSVKRIQKIKSVDSLMFGIYTGNVDQKKISKDAMNWLGKLD